MTAPSRFLTPAEERVIEYVAQALREHVGNRSGRGRAWSDLPETLRSSYRAEARVAIEAYRCALEFAPAT
jgi:hypothetical protein